MSVLRGQMAVPQSSGNAGVPVAGVPGSDTEFPFPFEPYGIQKRFMRELYDTLEAGNVGVFESPTGTVRVPRRQVMASVSRLASAGQNAEHHMQLPPLAAPASRTPAGIR